MNSGTSRTTLIVLSVAGVAILAGAVAWSISAVREARHNRQVMHDLSAISAEIDQDAKGRTGNQDTVEGASAKAQKMQDALGKAAANLSGDGAKAVRASERFMGAMKKYIARYESAYTGFISKGGLEIKTLTSEAAIEERLALLKIFAGANQEFADFLTKADSTYRQELTKEQFPAAQMDETAHGFHEGGNFSTLLAIRETDAELCTVMAKYLTLLKTEWGKWKTNEEGAILFQNESATTDFTSYVTQLQDVQERQTALQEKVLRGRQAPRSPGKQSVIGTP